MRSSTPVLRTALTAGLAAFALLACTDTPGERTTAPPVGGPLFAKGSNAGANLDQWANGHPPPTAESWQNGNLNGNNSAYAEGKAVPFRLAIEGLAGNNNTRHFITIQYDFTAGGHKAYDYLASIEATEPNALGQICATGGGGRSTLCGASQAAMPSPNVSTMTMDFPADGFTADGQTVDGAIAAGGVARALRIYNGTITSISAVSHAGPVDGNSTAEMLVEFTASGPAVLFAWSGHLAKSSYWKQQPGNLPDGAGQVSGSPWHMRTLNLDGGGAANQDRSIQPSAIVQNPTLTIAKTANPAGPVSAGTNIGFDISVTNNGPGTATALIVTDTLPSAFTWSISPSEPKCAIGTGQAQEKILTCNVGDLAEAASFSVHVTAATTTAACSTITNVAWADASNTNPVSDDASVTVLCPSIGLTKVADLGTVSAGTAIGFVISVSNGGPGQATGVTVTDNLPNNAGLSWSIDGENSDTGCGIASGVLTCNFGTLDASTSKHVHITSPTTSTSCATINNTANVTTTNNGGAQASASVVVQCPTMHITKVADQATVSAGTGIGFVITASNSGPGTATGVTVADNLPTTSGLFWSIDAANSDAGCSISAGVLTCNFGTMAPNTSKHVHITSPTTAASCATINNTGRVTATNGVGQQAMGSVVVQCPSLSIAKTPNAGTVNPGGTATFTITVSNAGPGAAFNVQIVDTLPSVAPNHWTDDQNACTLTSIAVPVGPTPRDSLFCNVGTLAAGGSFTVNVSATIPTGFTTNPPSPGTSADAIEIDGNLVDSPSGGPKDWETLVTACPGAGCAVDITPAASDNSFGEGTKEDDTSPTVVTGSIPPNKSDLLRFYTAKERFGTHDFLYLAWIRVNSPQGTTNMDFELNKLAPPAGGGIPTRSAGDILIKYDLSQGGTNPTLGFQRWLTSGPKSQCEAANATPCWGKAQALSAAQGVTGETNGRTVHDPIVNADLDPFTFGEASIDLQGAGIFPEGQCVSFGSAYLKSRSSDSFTSAIKDFIAPIPISLTNCSSKPLPNTAYTRASNFAPSGGAANAWISDPGLITVQTASASLLFAPASAQHLAWTTDRGSLAIGSATTPADPIETPLRGAVGAVGAVRAVTGRYDVLRA